jgi:hypothetical protein
MISLRGSYRSRIDLIRIDAYYGLLFLTNVAVAVCVTGGVPPVPETVNV